MESPPAPLRIVHHVFPSRIGGVERYFSGLLEHRSPRFELHHDLVYKDRIHPFLRDRIRTRCDRRVALHHLGGMPIPGWPRALRRALYRSRVRDRAGAVALFWNLAGRSGLARDARRAGLLPVHWERGAAWLRRAPSTRVEQYLGTMELVLANSHAGRRLLQLGWGYEGEVVVCRNGLRADAAPADAGGRPAPSGRPLVIGVASRLESFKGVPLALHALAELRARGLEAELRIAGQGPAEGELRALAQRLDIGGSVHLLGLVEDMDAFHRGIDLLLHPALREPCANVIPEAMARGVPVLATAVDGNPELVRHGRTGLLLEPELELAELPALGMDTASMPARVYHPASDSLVAPRAVAPVRWAEAVAGLVADSTRYEAMSTAAVAQVREELDARSALEHALAVLAGVTRR